MIIAIIGVLGLVYRLGPGKSREGMHTRWGPCCYGITRTTYHDTQIVCVMLCAIVKIVYESVIYHIPPAELGSRIANGRA